MNFIASDDLKRTRLVWLAVGLALVIRLCGIRYGLPFVYWTDEYHEVMRALELGAGGFNLSRTGKGGFYLILFLEYGFYYVGLKLTGLVSNAQEFAEQFVRDPTAFYLMGRATAAVFGCATVAAVFYLARQAYSATAGLLAALFLAFNVLHVDLSHRVGVDIPMTFFATLALYFGGRIASDGQRRDYVLAGLCAALATTTKLPGILVLLPLLIAHTYHVARSPDGPVRWLVSSGLWQSAAVFVVVLASTNPGLLLHFDALSLFTTPPNGLVEEDSLGTVVAVGSVGRPNLYLFYLNVLKSSMGWPLFVLSLVSVGHAIWKHRPSDVMLLSFALINYLAISSTSSEFLYYPRYALPIIVALSILSGMAVADLLPLISRLRKLSIVVLVSALIAWPVAFAIEETYLLTQTDTRTEAKAWFDAHVPAGSKVLIEGGKIAASRQTVPLEDSHESLERRIASWKTKEPRQAKFLEIKRVVQDDSGYDLELVQISSIAPLEDYVARGVEYFVIRPDSFLSSRKGEAGSARFLNDLRSNAGVKLLKRIDAGSDAQPGPSIEVYQMQSMVPTG